MSVCQPLGKVGASGNTRAPHLHMEARAGTPAAQFTVMAAYASGVTQTENANYILWRSSGQFVLFDPMLLLDPVYKVTQDALQTEAFRQTREAEP